MNASWILARSEAGLLPWYFARDAANAAGIAKAREIKPVASILEIKKLERNVEEKTLKRQTTIESLTNLQQT